MHTMTSLALALTMLQPAASTPSLTQGATAAVPRSQAQILDSRWIPDVGTVQLSSPGGPRLDVIVRELGGTEAIKQPVLDSLPPDSRIIEARSERYLNGDGLAIGLAVERQGTVSYHYLSTWQLRPESTPRPPDQPAQRGWLLTDPIFTSTGKPYRIVDVHCPGADNIEITFRRPFDQFRNKGLLDEKIYVQPCGGTSDPFAALGALFEAAGVQPVPADRIRPR